MSAYVMCEREEVKQEDTQTERCCVVLCDVVWNGVSVWCVWCMACVLVHTRSHAFLYMYMCAFL